MTNANLAVLLGGCFVIVVVITYILSKLFPCRGLNALLNTEVKYEPTPDVAIPAPDKPVRDLNELLTNWGSLEELNPKRKYTKRSKYWTDKRKKAAAAKARKTKPK
jgi:hypothetical protein